MCGIFFYHSPCSIPNALNAVEACMKMRARGPDNTQIYIEDNFVIGFHRLAINDLSPCGNQPMFLEDIILLCNGEIYNYKELDERYGLNRKSLSDCETIGRLYLKLRSVATEDDEFVTRLCQELDGEFAFIIYDRKLNHLIVARDPYGVRPLFVGYDDVSGAMGFASELKSLDDMFLGVEQMRPSIVNVYDLSKTRDSTWIVSHAYNDIDVKFDESNVEEDYILGEIRKKLERAVKTRNSGDVPICALLSGGLDSSLVCALLAREMKEPLHTFSIGFADAPDLNYARIVAKHIGSIHHEVIVTENEMLSAIPDVIKAIESYDVTTVRASVPNYLIARHISKNTPFKVVLTGEYSDELFNGYLYSRKAPTPEHLHMDSCRLLREITYYDSLRADRCITAHGLEARVPFSDPSLIRFVQSIHPKLKTSHDRIEKWLLRRAFDNDDLLPKKVLYRVKNAFSDAVSKQERSWYEVVQEHIEKISSVDAFHDKHEYLYCTPLTMEGYWMRRMFHTFYRNDKVIPKYWLPRWCGDVVDPSARTLQDVYEESECPVN